MVENPEALYVPDVCKVIIAGKICGKPEHAEIHLADGHIFQKEIA